MLEAQAPVDLTVGETAQLIITVANFLVAIAMTWYLLRGRTGRELKLRLLILAGGAICLTVEPFIDHVGGYWAADDGSWTVLKIYGHSLPLWLVPLYYWFLGGLTIMILGFVQRGPTKRALWRMYLMMLAVAVAIEMPFMWLSGNSEYYGNQSFYDADWVPVPLYFVAINAVWPFAMVATVRGMLWLDRAWLIPPAMLSTAYATYIAVGWPAFAALNSPVGSEVSYVAGAATLGLVALLMSVLAEIHARRPVPVTA